MTAIRAKSVCIFRNKDTVLLAEGYDPAKNENFLMPLGGGIEFGERSEQAAKREVLEEIGAVAYNFTLLAIKENLFVFNSVAGHEIVFVYAAEFEDSRFYDMVEMQAHESNGALFTAKWYTQDQLEKMQLNIYPQGIKDVLYQSQ